MSTTHNTNQIWGSIQNFSNSEIIYSFDLFVFLNLTTDVIQDNVLKSVSYTKHAQLM